jgi:hypothetical protein
MAIPVSRPFEPRFQVEVDRIPCPLVDLLVYATWLAPLKLLEYGNTTHVVC